jgi:hypothetical protein
VWPEDRGILGQWCSEIRLVKISLRTNTLSPICCTLTTARLGNWQQTYTRALSYTWGTSSRDEIVVNDKRFVVRDNLYDFLFLESLNPACAGSYYWIDQLCIGQSNIDERNQQVSMMASVYSSAYSGLVIWLGVGSAASDWAMDIIQQLPPTHEHVLDIAPFRAVRSVDDLKE